jgi:serine/threonine protein kinase
MAPEVKSGNYGMSSDVYSIGLVLYEIFEKKLPNFDPDTKLTTVPKIFGVCYFLFIFHLFRCYFLLYSVYRIVLVISFCLIY